MYINDDQENGYGTASFDSPNDLSDSGRARRDAMLPLLEAAVVREGRRRRVRRSVARGVATAALFILVGVALVNTWPTSHRPGGLRDDLTDGPPDPLITIVQIDPGALGRYTFIADIDPGDYIVDDKEFVAALAAIGRPAGLIRSEGKIRLTHAVTDAELTPPTEIPDSEASPPNALPDNQPS